MNAKNWYVLSHACRPSVLLELLERKFGVDNVWWPYQIIGGSDERISLFPGYIFVSVEEPRLVEKVLRNDLKLIFGFLPLNSESARKLTEQEIVSIKELESSNKYIEIPDSEIKVGDLVTTGVDTAFVGLRMKVVAIKNNLAEVCVTLFGRDTIIKLHTGCLKKYDKF